MSNLSYKCSDIVFFVCFSIEYNIRKNAAHYKQTIWMQYNIKANERHTDITDNVVNTYTTLKQTKGTVTHWKTGYNTALRHSKDTMDNLCTVQHQENTSSPPVFSGVRVTRSLVFCVMYWMFVLLSLHCLSFLNLRLLVDPLGIF